MNRVRWGLVGAGLYAETHLQAFRSLPSAEVTALYDPDRTRAALLASRFGIRNNCSSLEELLALPEVDAVDVLTPESLHLEPTVRAFGAGKHVFLEKPMATDLDHCAQMMEAHRVSGRAFMVGHIVRFETKYAMMKDAIASGRLGRVVSIHARRNRRKSLLSRYNRTPPCVENSIHDIDALLWYVGRPVQRVRGYARHATGAQHHDTFWGILEFEGGALGVVETIWLVPDASGVRLDDQLQVVGDKGIGNLNLTPGSLTFWCDDGPEVPDVSYDPVVGGAVRGALREELGYFCECVLTGRQPEVTTPIEAKRAVRVALALLQSSLEERDVEIGEWD